MRKIICFLTLLMACQISYGQTLDDISRMSIQVQTLVQSNITIEARNFLEDRMHQIITVNGISDNGLENRFAMTATVSILTKDVIAGSPTRISQKLEVTFYIKDVVENKTYGSATVKTVGVGLNENKSFITAFSNIKSGNPRIQDMISSTKAKIVEYYRTNIDRYISEAYTLVGQGRFDEALYNLGKVPDVCYDAYEKSMNATLDIYKKKIDSEGLVLFNKAKGVWAQSPNAEGAAEAITYLEYINILSACMPDVNMLLEEMKAKVKDDQKKAWEFKLRQYEDTKAREQRDFEFKVRQYEEAEAKDERRHQEDLAREQRDFDFTVHQFDENMGFKRAIVDASKETILGVAGTLKK